MAEIKGNIEDNDKDKYLLFLLGSELYGVPLLGVKEVIEYKSSKPIPNMVEHFEGVINLRGEIIGVLDLRKKMGIDGDHPTCQLIFQTDAGSLAATVDSVLSVANIPEGQIDHKPNIESKVDIQYFIGVGHFEESLVNIIDLKKVLSAEQLVAVGHLKASGS